jgi:hypothetical protein
MVLVISSKHIDCLLVVNTRIHRQSNFEAGLARGPVRSLDVVAI